MNIPILGGDGYPGLPTATHFSVQADAVWVAHNFAKQKWGLEDGFEPSLPTLTLHHWAKYWNDSGVGEPIHMKVSDLANHRFVCNLRETKPDAIAPHIRWTVGEITEDKA